MDEAIKLAIEKGGYNAGLKVTHFAKGHAVDENRVVLDPLFWQALGKALGWIQTTHHHDQCMQCGEDDLGGQPEWQYQAHRYFELVLTGGDTEKFWKDLLTN